MPFLKCGGGSRQAALGDPASPSPQRGSAPELDRRDPGAKLGRAAGREVEGVVFLQRLSEHRVPPPPQECGETWQMVTCACPQCGGPEARTYRTALPPASPHSKPPNSIETTTADACLTSTRFPRSTSPRVFRSFDAQATALFLLFLQSVNRTAARWIYRLHPSTGRTHL